MVVNWDGRQLGFALHRVVFSDFHHSSMLGQAVEDLIPHSLNIMESSMLLLGVDTGKAISNAQSNELHWLSSLL